jgi:geranylgeranyl reductase family protein
MSNLSTLDPRASTAKTPKAARRASEARPSELNADVAILGAGPAGTAAAVHLGQLGVKDVVLVDKHDFPRDKTCGSGISPKGIKTLRDLGVWEDIEPHAYPIKGIRIVTPAGRESVQSAGDKAEAIVCCRRVFDHALLQKAVARGTTFLPHFVASEAIEENGRTAGFVARDGRTVRAKYTLIAGGAHCRVGVPKRDTRRLIHAIMGWWEGVPFTPNVVEMAFDKMVAPYYGWLFPESDRVVNIGITYPDDPHRKENARELFQRFLDAQYGNRLRSARQIGDWKGHPIAYSLKIGDLTGPGKLILGESGLMTHPATAEGIYQGMRSGMLAAEAVAEILSERSTEKKAFAAYERRCKLTFQMSFWAGEAFRRLITTSLLDRAIAFSETPVVKHTAAKILAAI